MKAANAAGQLDLSDQSPRDWEMSLASILPLYGHRNWLVVADSAYPAQSAPGIRTLLARNDQKTVIERVLALFRSSSHIRPTVHVDKELEFVAEEDAPGVESYREWLKVSLQGLSTEFQLHEDIISKLDRAAQTFSVTVIKTMMTIPYTTVFFELDCAYWDPDRERRLRSAMQG
jgi:hypothetical protein